MKAKNRKFIIVGMVIIAIAAFSFLAVKHTFVRQNVLEQFADDDDDDKSIPAGYKTIVIAKGAFTPEITTVKKQTIVTWSNKDKTAYTIVVPKMGWHVGPIKPNSSQDVKFNFAGTYEYYELAHPSIKGSVIVVQ